MPAGPSVLKGCLPVWIIVAAGRDADTPNGPGEYWEEVEEIRWLKRDGTPGAPISERLWDEAEKADPYFCNMLEIFWDTLRHEAAEARRREDGCECDYAAAFTCLKNCKHRPFQFSSTPGRNPK